MNIVKLGGSIVNPDGRYDDSVITEFIEVVRNSSEKFIFVVGGGYLCRQLQDACQPFIENALHAKEWVVEARDSIGIATTKINARYVMRRFQDVLGNEVHAEVIMNPSKRVESNARIFIATGWKPGHSTDNDMMLLAKAYEADTVYKISNFPFVKRISPTSLAAMNDDEKKEALASAENLTSITWNELQELIGDEWDAGLNTPFDPAATALGVELKNKVTVCIGTKEAFLAAAAGEKFIGTVVQG